MNNKLKIYNYIKKNKIASGKEIINLLKITRQSINIHIKNLIKEGKIIAEGKTKGTTYCYIKKDDQRPTNIKNKYTERKYDKKLIDLSPLNYNKFTTGEYNKIGPLEQLNNYAHGYVAIPTILALREKGFFQCFQNNTGKSLEKLSEILQAKNGHLKVALRILESLEWITCDRDRKYRLTPRSNIYKDIPGEVYRLFHYPFSQIFTGSRELKNQINGDTGTREELSLRKWVQLSKDRWRITDECLALFADGLLLVPLLVFICKNHLIEETAETLNAIFKKIPEIIQRDIIELFINKGWVRKEQTRSYITDIGRFMITHGLNLATVYSYRPMLSKINELIFGDHAIVFKRSVVGSEMHINRTVNVVGSGFQHTKYFNDLNEIIIDTFNREPINDQPNYIADMGCGSGDLLKKVFETIKERTIRGKDMTIRPVMMIGIDYNEEALKVAKETLHEIPHIIIKGDIGNPEAVLTELSKKGISTEEILHIRSFLDHDRRYSDPNNRERAAQRKNVANEGIYVDEKGGLIAPSLIIQDLVEHLKKWQKISNRHGLILLEVHRLSVDVVKKYLFSSESLHFDAFHAYSGQYLVTASDFHLAAAEAGLFLKCNFSKRYPEILPYTRITLNYFEKRPYTIRNPAESDIDDLILLDKRSWTESLRMSKERIQKWVREHPEWIYVLEKDNEIAGVLYTQRIKSEESLKQTTFKEVDRIRDSQAKILQLILIQVSPEKRQIGLGDALLEFALQHCILRGDINKVVGISRCKEYREYSHLAMEEYIRLCNEHGLVIDSILRFHQLHGAKIKNVLKKWRPEDTDNKGMGVIIEYDLGYRKPGAYALPEKEIFKPQDSDPPYSIPLYSPFKSTYPGHSNRPFGRVLIQLVSATKLSQNPFMVGSFPGKRHDIPTTAIRSFSGQACIPDIFGIIVS